MQSDEKITCFICGGTLPAFPKRWQLMHMREHVAKGEAVEVKDICENVVLWVRAKAGQVVPIPEELRFKR